MLLSGDNVDIIGKPLNLSTIEYSRPDRVTALVNRWTVLTKCLGRLLRFVELFFH